MGNKAVIGLGFGDCGKGLTTDYLCSQAQNPLVIRYSGGQQAGHTVNHKGISHVFSNLGSGSLRGVPTYWSKYCTFDPIGLFNELEALKDKGIVPTIYIDANSPVTTPFDSHHNQKSATDLENGTCGVGVGSTLKREEDYYSLTFSDLFNATVLEIKLKNIRAYYGCDMVELYRFMTCVNAIIQMENVILVEDIPLGYEYIFEGSQGLLLDKNIGFFPNVTRSNVDTTNIFKMGLDRKSVA